MNRDTARKHFNKALKVKRYKRKPDCVTIESCPEQGPLVILSKVGGHYLYCALVDNGRLSLWDKLRIIVLLFRPSIKQEKK